MDNVHVEIFRVLVRVEGGVCFGWSWRGTESEWDGMVPDAR